MKYYDMHTHILPELDDGAKSVEMSLEIIEKLKSQNVKNISLTPHYYSNQESIEDFLAARQESLDKLLPVLPKDIKVCVGAEVYVTQYLFNNKDISSLTYGNTDFILCEFPFNSDFSKAPMEFLFRIQNNYGLTPVITHIERYPKFFKNRELIEDCLYNGMHLQTNVESLFSFKTKGRILKYIKEGYISVIGTDSHSLVRGSCEKYGEAISIIEKKCGQDAVKDIMKNCKKIFGSA